EEYEKGANVCLVSEEMVKKPEMGNWGQTGYEAV
ncbi:hypothetical protein EVA_13363, partial [gut metagenome]